MQLPGMLNQLVGREAPKTDEHLIDAVGLDAGRELLEHCLHALAHVTVEFVVRREQVDAALAYQLLDLECRRAHGDTGCLELFGERDDAAVVIGKYAHGLAAQPRLKHSLARDVEAVAVHKADYTGYSWMTERTTPHTWQSTSMSGTGA